MRSALDNFKTLTPEENLDNRNTALVVEDLNKYFGSEEVLKGISLEASEGDVIAMVGASGSGKSTFLRCLNLLEIPTSGRIFVRGELIRMKQDRYGVTVPEDLNRLNVFVLGWVWFFSSSIFGLT